jgi:hypothetical protein
MIPMRSVCVLFCLVGVAHARSEDTAAQCSDHYDNDGNGLIDCDDPKCSGFGRCRLSLVDPEMDAPTTGKGQMTAGVIMLVAGPALAGAAAAVFVDGLPQGAATRRTLELSMGGILTAAATAITITGVALVHRGWRRYKEDVEMGLALGPTNASLRIKF